MEYRIWPLTVVEVIDLLTSGKEKLATELITELVYHERTFKKERVS